MSAPPYAGRPRVSGRAFAAIGIAVVSLLLYLPSLGVGDFVGDDEALDAGVVWEMRRSGDWLFPEFNGEYLPPKPPLFYWAAAAVSKLHGRVDEWSLRAPSALAAATTVGVTVAGAADLVGLGPAVLAGLMLATMPLVVGEARMGRCDMLLALVVAACLFIVARPRAEATARASRWLVWSLLGLAALTKGGAGVGLIVAVVALQALVDRDLRQVRELAHPSIVAFFIVGGTWYAIATAHWGKRFVDEQIIGENLHHLIGGGGISDRGSGTMPLGEHLIYYAAPLFLKMLPWSLWLPGAILRFWKSSAERERLSFFAVWLVAGLAFFTLVSRKSPYYLLPLAPPVAVLCAASTYASVRDSIAAGIDIAVSKRTGGLLLAAAALICLAAFAIRGAPCRLQAAASAIGEHPLTSTAALWLLAVSTYGIVAALRARRLGRGIVFALAASGALIVLSDHVEGRLDDCGSLKRFAADVRENVRPEEPLFFFRYPLPAVVLYAQRQIPTLDGGQAPQGPFYLIVPQSLAGELPARWREDAETVSSRQARVFTRRRMAIHLLRISRHEDDDVPVGTAPSAQEARKPRFLGEHDG